MNREDYLTKTFPLSDGTTYTQNIDKHMGVYEDGNNRVYQWELQKELKFLNYIKDCGEYTLEDADKLNSITNLYNHIKNGTIS